MTLSARPASLACAWAGGGLFVVSLTVFLHSYLFRFNRIADGGDVLFATAINAVLFSAFALHHSLFPRSGAKAFIGRIASPALERSIYTWVSSALFILVCVLWRPVPGELYNVRGIGAIGGYLIQFAGIVVTIRAAAALDPLDLA